MGVTSSVVTKTDLLYSFVKYHEWLEFYCIHKEQTNGTGRKEFAVNGLVPSQLSVGPHNNIFSRNEIPSELLDNSSERLSFV